MFNVLIFLRATTAVAVASCIKQLTSVFAFCQFWHLQLICLGGIVSERYRMRNGLNNAWQRALVCHDVHKSATQERARKNGDTWKKC
jgi:hypothetical protein